MTAASSKRHRTIEDLQQADGSFDGIALDDLPVEPPERDRLIAAIEDALRDLGIDPAGTDGRRLTRNMLCLANIVAVAAVLGLEKAEGTILRLTLPPAAVFAVIAGVVSFAL